MTKVQTSAPNEPLMPSLRYPGAEAELIIKNISEEAVHSEEIEIRVSAPSHVEVTLERAINQDGYWEPLFDIHQSQSIRIPVFVRSEVYREEKGGKVQISIQVYDEVHRSEIDLAG